MMNMEGGEMYQFEEKYQFEERDLETFLDACMSYESQGKKVSECVLKFDYTFMINSLDKKTAKVTKEIEKEKKNNKTTESKNAAKGGAVVVDLKSMAETDEVKNEDPPEAVPKEKD